MGILKRAISADASAVAIAVDTTDIVGKIEKIHQTSAVVTAALGRLSTAASLMGYSLKNKGDSITVRMDGRGPAGVLIAVAVGKDGTLNIVKDMGLKEPYVGRVPIVSGEIAEDIVNYYATSEQIPTVCGLGVLVNPDLSVNVAGGYLVQLLPFASDSVIDTIENNIKNFSSVTQMMSKGITMEEMALKLLDGLNPNILDESKVSYKCDCSKDRVRKALISLGADELNSMADEQEETEVKCHFCNKKYLFSRDDIRKLIR